MARCRPSGKACHGQIEASPEEVHRAHLTEKAGAEICKYVVRREEYAPEAVGIVAVVGGVHIVPIEWDAIRDLGRHRRYGYFDVKFGEGGEQLGEKLRYRPGREHELTKLPIARSYPQHMVDEVEVDLEGATPIGNRRRRQPARRQVQRHMPGVVQPRRLRQPYLADDLRPKMKRLAGVLPVRVMQLGPPVDLRN